MPSFTHHHSKMKLSCAFLFIHVIFLSNYVLGNEALGNETDRFALLKLRESISDDPRLVLSSWNDSVHFCDWRGIACGSRHQRVTILDLEGYGLRGTISPHIGNLSFLRHLILRNNRFLGEIPREVTRLFRLRYLDLGNNTLEGEIPTNLSLCSRLEMLSLGRNRLGGIIPSELGSLVKLEGLYLPLNNLRGSIPASLGNISSLEAFSAASNALAGMIPRELGRLKGLTEFTIGLNNLSGTVPLSLYNMSSPRIFSLARNRFNGVLPPTIGLTLPRLQRFEIAGNKFSGIIPESISNASQLKILDMANNNFFGQVPRSLGNLQSLLALGLSNNSLGSYPDNSLDFITYLTNCSQMRNLDLSLNDFGGALPNSVANFSSNFIGLFLGSNEINGYIPETFGNLANLIILSMEFNNLSGEIPTSLGRLRNLQIFALEGNSLSGNIPSSLGNLTRLSELDLSDNNLEGSIQPNLGNCKSLQYLDISKNRLTGVIPNEVFDIFSLSLLLDLSRNSLTGSLPIEVGKLKNIIEIDLSENNLTNGIPETIGGCESLTILDLHENFFQGSLPYALASLKVLEYLDLSQNNLTGPIPKDLEKLQFLALLNISFNDLDGEVPNNGVFQNTSAVSLAGNSKLCGGVTTLELPRCLVVESKEGNKAKTHKLAVIVVCTIVITLLLLCFVILLLKRKSTRKALSSISTISFLSKVSYKTLYQATDGFSPNMLIGAGSFGSVYKALLGQEKNPFAIKVLNLQRKGAEKSFIVECNALRNVRHRNLVKILTCCSSTDYNGNDFKALVYEYMSNGSLDNWLHDLAAENQSRGLSLIQRVNIAMDVASATHYLHEDCDQPVIHCDLKPSNVLLDNEMVAHVSDFGLARLISNTMGISRGETSTIGIKGTIGYAAPEYAMGGEPSKQGDVYSYGILVLEMFTGKRPTDEMFRGDFNLHNFVETELPHRLAQIMDSALLPREMREALMSRDDVGNEIIEAEEGNISSENTNPLSAHLQRCLISALEIGLACSRESPNERMNMGDVTRELQHIRSAYIADGMREQR